ncbi:MAG: hypothetical protein HC848_04200 [Limnobacter sp.]|nr:hypothetical protein [Limnobacter sp.]
MPVLVARCIGVVLFGVGEVDGLNTSLSQCAQFACVGLAVLVEILENAKLVKLGVLVVDQPVAVAV